MISKEAFFIWLFVVVFFISSLPKYSVRANNKENAEDPIIDDSLKVSPSSTDDKTVEREEDTIKIDGLSVAEQKRLREMAEKHEFNADVSRVMRLIINSIYKNKEIFLRELISNSADALNKIRFASLTNPSVLATNDQLAIYVKADKENHVLHITDTGIGMTKEDLLNNLGTIARSGTAEFLSKMAEASAEQQQNLIGQFGVGFYSSFLVADRVVVTTKHNDDKQYIWESDSSSFSVVEDPRGPTLKRGTQVSLHLKEEAYDFLEPDTLKKLIEKYSQFVDLDIYLWQSKTETVDKPTDTKDEKKSEDGAVEEEKETKKETETRTVWDYEHINAIKPIWTRSASEVKDEEYKEFYKRISKDSEEPLAYIHSTAEGEVTFKTILYIPKTLANDAFQNYGKTRENIKLFVRRIFITDDFKDMLPKYLAFIRGIIDSDDLPLNVSRETLQQNKLMKVIKKKLVRKVLDMLKKIQKKDPELYEKFWKEYSTNIKLGVMEDPTNRNRLSKLLRFHSSYNSQNQTTLAEYVERMKEKQDAIYYIAGTTQNDLKNSPFVERLLKKGFEVLYLTDSVDEYCIQAMPEYEGKKFQNIAKEGLNLDTSEKSKEAFEQLEKTYKVLLDWLMNNALTNKIEKAVVSRRLTTSPSALVAQSFGWSGNMERIMKSQAYAKSNDVTQEFYANQKKIFEINPYHPVVKELLRRVEQDSDDTVAKSTALLLFDTATLRSGYSLSDQVGFAERIENVLRKSLDLSVDEPIEQEPEFVEDEANETEKTDEENAENAENEEKVNVEEKHTEL